MDKPNGLESTTVETRPITEMTHLRLCEGVSGVWHYHLCSVTSNSTKGLCGDDTMHSEAPIASWGYKPEHIRHSYCTECERMAKAGHR